MTAVPRRRQLELQYEGKTFNRDISLVPLSQPKTSTVWTSIASTPWSPKLSHPHPCMSKGKPPKRENLWSSRTVQPKVGSYPRCFDSYRISSKSDNLLRQLRRLRTTSIARFKNARKGSAKSASAERGTSDSESMSEGLLTSHPIRTTRTCKSGKES